MASFTLRTVLFVCYYNILYSLSLHKLVQNTVYYIQYTYFFKSSFYIDTIMAEAGRSEESGIY